MDVAVGQRQGADRLGMAGDEDLRHTPAAVVADDRHLVEAQRIEEGREHGRLRGEGEILIAGGERACGPWPMRSMAGCNAAVD